tara:strand:- start:120 stop:521 length:402 start_codon:yes stop_codon:yes gene_type:complete
MSTRAQVRFATREDGVSFSEHPEKIHAQFYNHSDGYPEGLGMEIAESLLDSTKIDGWEIEYLDTRHSDLEYIYYIWQAPGKTTWISIFEVGWEQPCQCCGAIKTEDQWEDSCIFVGEPQKLIDKYKENTNNDG